MTESPERLLVAVFEQGQRVLDSEGLSEGDEHGRVNALDRGPAEDAQRAGARDARLGGQSVGRAPTLRPHVRFQSPIDHASVYAYYSHLTSRQRTLTILPYTKRGEQ